MPALALLLPFGIALGALLPQLPELLRIVEEAGDALLAHPEPLALALPCQGRREVPVVVFKHVAHPRERRPEALFPERDVIEVDAVIPGSSMSSSQRPTAKSVTFRHVS